MEKKTEKLLKKIHIKDYTNALEKVLEKKEFSTDTKNLLLSMFYKIENSYKDYSKTKIEVYEKGAFLDKLLYIIEVKCNQIIVAKLNSEEAKILEKEKKDFIINKEEGKIILIGNEVILLNCILLIAQEDICVTEEETLLQKSITYLLNAGTKMNEVEVIRDFNGWSWDVSTKSIENIKINLIFQTLLNLLGYEFINNWIENNSQLADYLMLTYEKLKDSFGEERAKSITTLFLKLIVESIIKQDKEQKEEWKKVKEKVNKEYEKINNKKQYLDEITQKKKELTQKIKEIDKIINNKTTLQQEYAKRNENLPNKEKIFSTRQLVNKLEIERQEYINKIKIYNNLIDPNGYINIKEKINTQYEFLNDINFKEAESNKKIIELCLAFLSCFQINISKATTKQQIIEYIYKLRYYCFLTFNEQGTILKNVPELKEEFEKTIQLLLKKSKSLGVIDEVTEDEEVNYDIISKIFESKMIDLNNMVIETKVEDKKLFADYYDGNILETTYEIYSKKTVKLKKKTKLFI